MSKEKPQHSPQEEKITLFIIRTESFALELVAAILKITVLTRHRLAIMSEDVKRYFNGLLQK